MKVIKIEGPQVTMELSRQELRGIFDALELGIEAVPDGVAAMLQQRFEAAFEDYALAEREALMTPQKKS